MLRWVAVAGLGSVLACSHRGGSEGSSTASGSSGANTSGGSSSGGGSSGGCSGTGVAVPAGERIPNGNPILPPKWAFGVLYGSYFDQTGTYPGSPGNLLDAATKIRADYAGDLMWIDSSWLSNTFSSAATAKNYICFQFDANTFPDPRSMVARLRQQHFHFGVWEWPWMDQGCQYYGAGVSMSYFVGGANPANAGGWHGNTMTAAFDYTNPAAVAWWNGLNQPLVEMGLDFMKLDTGGGPPAGTLFDGSKDYRRLYHQTAFELTAKYSEGANPDAADNGGRGFILAHTDPSPGNDQTPGMWTNDTRAGFPGLQSEMQTAASLNHANDAAFWCGDTAGYNGNPTDENYIRWLEYTAFTPCQEIFGSKDNSTGILNGNRFPFNFSPQAQQIFKQYTQLRYRLLPFRYSNAQATYHESPVKYAVAWVGATQLILSGSGDSQILVQPVTTEGATTAAVTLPAGSSWTHYWTGASYPGGATATVAAPIDQEPIFVKAGSIIPMGPPLHWVDEAPADPLTLDIYPAESTSYTLYEDDGITRGYLGGAYSTTRFSSTLTGGHVGVTIGAQATARYPYAGQLCSRTYVLKINGQATAPTSVMRDGNVEPMSSAAAFSSAAEGWYYDAVAQTVWVKFALPSELATTVSL
jgi:alpha-D-xyloside xylohydrolase